jgi:hypothetical protein
MRKKQIETSSNESIEKNLWIVKPTNSSRGRGIRIIDNVSEVTKEECIISIYI